MVYQAKMSPELGTNLVRAAQWIGPRLEVDHLAVGRGRSLHDRLRHGRVWMHRLEKLHS